MGMHYKTVWISDVHLGTDICKSKELLRFFRNNSFDKVYLNGDIIDLIQMRKKVFWGTDHSTVVQKILRMDRKNTKVIYVIGNHDIYISELVGTSFGDIDIVERDIHVTVTGEKILTLHGHQFDGIVKTQIWLYFLGDMSYRFALFINKWYNRFSKIFGRPYWSLSLYLKTKVKNIIKFVGKFEEIVTSEAKKEDVNIVCAGHIHVCQDTTINGIRYLNSGCWTEYCSCVVEHLDGKLQVLMVN